MTTVYLALLTLCDVLILGFIYFKVHKKQGSVELLAELSDERQLLKNLQEEITRDLTTSREQVNGQLRKVIHIAAEVERDAKVSKENIAAQLQSIFSDFTDNLEGPMVELTKKQHLIENLIRKSEASRERLLAAIQKGEKISRFFNNDLPYEELLKEIELKKYQDARHLLTQGFSSEKVANELGMRLTEVELMQGALLR